MELDPQVQTLTPKGAATRQRIVDGAIAAIHDLGVHDATLDDMRDRSRTSKGQLFHYFPDGREALLLAVAEEEARRVIGDQQPHLADLTSWESWFAWRDLVLARYRRQGQHCPLSTVISGIGRPTPATQRVAATVIGQWQGDLARGIRAMQETGLVDRHVSPTDAAAATVAGIQGGVTMMLSTGSIAYLEASLTQSLAALGAPEREGTTREVTR